MDETEVINRVKEVLQQPSELMNEIDNLVKWKRWEEWIFNKH